MAQLMSLDGIDRAISNLGYRGDKSLKRRLVRAVRDAYSSESSIESVVRIDSAELVKTLWDTGNDPTLIRKKRQSLSSLKSSVNADLKKLFKAGKNPEGILIGQENGFVICDEAKDQILAILQKSMKAGKDVSLARIAEVLGTVHELLGDPDILDFSDPAEGAARLKRLTDLVRRLSRRLRGLEGVEENPGDDGKAPGREEGAEQGSLEKGREGEDQRAAGSEKGAAAEAERKEGLERLEGSASQAEASMGRQPAEGEAEGDTHADDPRADQLNGGGEDEEQREAELLGSELKGHLRTAERHLNQYVLIPAGTYTIGRPVPEGNETPERKAHLEAFRIGRFPVTNALFEVFIEKTGYRTTAEKVGFGMVYAGRYQRLVNERTGAVTLVASNGVHARMVSKACWYQPTGPGSTLSKKRDHPVVQVSLEDAMAFASWAGKRLPTEEEWEAATRTTTGSTLPWGDEWKKNCCNSEESYTGDTTSVEQYLTCGNELGVVDAVGNVWEWTLDVSEQHPSLKAKARHNILKGGSWLSRQGIRLFDRFSMSTDSTSNAVGFRCLAS